MTVVDKQVRTVRRKLLEAAYGASFKMLEQTTQLSKSVLVDALELCEDASDPASEVLQMWRNWQSSTEYRSFPEYVRWRSSTGRVRRSARP